MAPTDLTSPEETAQQDIYCFNLQTNVWWPGEGHIRLSKALHQNNWTSQRHPKLDFRKLPHHSTPYGWEYILVACWNLLVSANWKHEFSCFRTAEFLVSRALTVTRAAFILRLTTETSTSTSVVFAWIPFSEFRDRGANFACCSLFSAHIRE